MKRIFSIALMLAFAASFAAAQVPASNHVFMIVEENHSYSSVIGNTAMPYFNSLANKYGVATQYYGNTHPSIGNYFMMTTGQIYTNDDTFTSTINIDNIVRHMMTSGKTWKSYAEGLPYAGYTGGNTGYYLKRHNPFAYFSDVANSSSEKLNLVPFTQLSTDLANNQVPNLSYIAPNIMDDAHNGTLQQADSWLATYVPKILASPAFTNNGLLIITFDESFDTDTAYGGGHIATLVISPNGKGGYKSTVHYAHQNLLKTVMQALGMTTSPAAAATATPMSDFFGTSTPTPAPTPINAGVTVTSPTAGATAGSPVHFVASATGGGYPITAMRIYVDNTSMYTVNAASLDTYLALASGGHSVVIQAWNSAGTVYKQAMTVNVSGSSTTSTAGVTITSPSAGATYMSPVHVVASASCVSGRVITAMRIYVDSTSVYTVSAASLNTYVAMSAGSHNVTINAWDNTGAVYKSTVLMNVQ